MSKATTVDEYFETLAGDARAHLTALRRLSHASAPGSVETLKWGHPAMVHAEGTILFVYSAHKQHANVVFTPSTLAAFEDELAGYETGKGRVQLTYGDAIPNDLIGRMMQFRVTEFEERGVNWK